MGWSQPCPSLQTSRPPADAQKGTLGVLGWAEQETPAPALPASPSPAVRRVRNPSVSSHLGQRRCQTPRREQGLELSYLLSQLLPQESILCARGGIQWPSRGGGAGRESEGAGRCRGWASTACPESPARQAYDLSPGRMAPGPRQAGHTERAGRGHRQWSVTSQGGHTQTEDRDRLHQGETHSRPGLVRQADGQTGEGKSSRQAGGQRGRRKERQAGRQAAVWLSVTLREEQTVGPGAHGSLGRAPWVCQSAAAALPRAQGGEAGEDVASSSSPRRPCPQSSWPLPEGVRKRWEGAGPLAEPSLTKGHLLGRHLGPPG